MTQPDPFPSPEPTPPASPPMTRARRRRARRAFFPSDAEGQETFLGDLARRSYPSFDLYLYSLLAGIVISVGYLFDSQALLFFGALTAPVLTVWVGMLIAASAGSIRLFFHTFAALLISTLLVFLFGLVAGLVNAPLEPHTLSQVYLHSQLWWPDLIILTIGALLLVVSFVRTDEKPYLPSAVLAYELYLPASAAGFGLGAKLDSVWPQAAQIFLIHFAWAALLGLLALALMRFQTRTLGGFAFRALLFIVMLVILLTWTGVGGLALDWTRGIASGPPAAPLTFSPPPSTSTGAPSPRPSASPSATPPRSADTATPTLLGGGITLPPTLTPTVTPTIEPTPIYAKINAPEGGGAFVRKNPGFDSPTLLILSNGTIVEVLGETQEANNVIWVKIAVVRNGVRQEGWIIQSLLAMPTPIVNWEPTGTFTPTP